MSSCFNVNLKFMLVGWILYWSKTIRYFFIKVLIWERYCKKLILLLVFIPSVFILTISLTVAAAAARRTADEALAGGGSGGGRDADRLALHGGARRRRGATRCR